MSSILEQLGEALQGGNLEHLSQQLGADEQATRAALSGALPILMGALARNSADSGGANALASALDRDHDGSILDDIGGFLQQGPSAAGDGILGHVLGQRRGTVEASLSKSSGLDAATVAKLLATVAPLVMAYLGRAKQERGLDGGALADLLGGEQRRVAESEPKALGMLGALLDRDGDGDVVDDVAKIGGGLLGRFLGGR